MLLGIEMGMEPEKFGRIHHLPKPFLAEVLAALQERGLVTPEKTFTPEGRALKDLIEDQTDAAAAPAYDVLTADETDELVGLLERMAAAIEATEL